MKILDSLGEVLETRVSVVKIDVVLGIEFVTGLYRHTTEELIDHYLDRYNVTLYSHDFARAEHIRRLHQMHVFDHQDHMDVPISYFADTLTVMYEWIGRHKPVFMYAQKHDAYQLFLLLCQSYRCYSVLNLKEDDRDFLFNYIYMRDFIDHTLPI